MKWLTSNLIAAVFVSGIFSNSVSAQQYELFTVNEGLPQNYLLITPPWWQTWWAYAAYILIALSLIISFFYYRVRRTRLRQEMILQQKQTEQLRAIDEMKTRFFSNITHEFRTPLSLIISPVEKLQNEVKDEKVLNTLDEFIREMTAKISYESRLSALQLGADDYINKPFHFDELDTRIRNLLDHQRKQRENYRIQLQKNGSSVQSNESENPFLKNIYAIIDEMIDDSQLGASKLAEKNAMSLRTLNRKLNTMIGMSAGHLIRQYRLQKSITLLKEGHNVSETAYLVGFETPAYFSQCFKEQYGVSPKDYPL
jgi:AraC-like DNA-binding protein